MRNAGSVSLIRNTEPVARILPDGHMGNGEDLGQVEAGRGTIDRIDRQCDDRWILES